jgi:hypothetical protein
MKVFISWSGERSKLVAQAVREWLPTVIQAVKPYFSPDDVAKGTRWSSEIALELQASSFGILCVTPDNVDAPWMVFEAGALSKSLDKARVCPLLFNLEPTAISGPLSQFQSARFDKAEVERLVRAMNKELGESALAPNVLDKVFEMWWPHLQTRITQIENTPAPEGKTSREPADMLDELLALSRNIATAVQARRGPVSQLRPLNQNTLDALVADWRELVHIAASSSDENLIAAVVGLRRPIGMMLRRIGASRTASAFYATPAEFFLSGGSPAPEFSSDEHDIEQTSENSNKD